MIEASDKKAELTEDIKDLEQRLSDLDLFVDRRRLPAVAFLQRNPWRIQDLQNLQLQKARACASSKEIFKCFPDLLATTGLKIDVPRHNLKGEPTNALEYLKLAEKTYRESEALFQQALASLSAEEKEYLKAHAVEMTDRLSQGIYLHEDEDQYRLLRDLKMMGLMQKVDVGVLAKSLIPFQKLLNPAVLQKLKSDANAKKEIVSEYKSTAGVFILGGTGPNNYTNAFYANPVFILDLGGDDFYPDISANIIDLDGNDLYEASKPWTLASGILRTRILIDQNGNDIYQASDGGIASSLFGASLLLDQNGNDIYRSRIYSMGSAWTGFAALIDVKGSDVYQSQMLSQGLGIAGGVGLLMDYQGNDSYYSKGANPSVYQDPGQFDGWSQGVGLGLRNFVSGGWGFLYDGQGQDRFESGTFSQGGGYYFGLGTLINDGDEDDLYMGARYSQGFTAHYAIGNFLEIGGRDVYLSPSDVGQGMAWDLSLTLFEDRAGNDTYKTCAHCLGMASQNSFAFFIDGQGQDNYSGADLPFGGKRSNDYHGGKSFGLFWDQHHEIDQYSKFKNNSQQTLGDWQILKDE